MGRSTVSLAVLAVLALLLGSVSARAQTIPASSIEVTASSEYGTQFASNVLSGVNDVAGATWLTIGYAKCWSDEAWDFIISPDHTDPSPFIQFNFDRAYRTIDHVALWNYYGDAGCGIAVMNVWYATGFGEDQTFTLLDRLNLSAAGTADNSNPPPRMDILQGGLLDIPVTAIRFEILLNGYLYGDGEYYKWFGLIPGLYFGELNPQSVEGVYVSQVGMTGVEFHLVPEPATMSLLALGGLALLRRRRHLPDGLRK